MKIYNITYSKTGFSPAYNNFKPIVGGCNEDSDISDEGLRANVFLLVMDVVDGGMSSGRNGQGTKKLQPTMMSPYLSFSVKR